MQLKKPGNIKTKPNQTKPVNITKTQHINDHLQTNIYIYTHVIDKPLHVQKSTKIVYK